jgi:hypothetical protein
MSTRKPPKPRLADEQYTGNRLVTYVHGPLTFAFDFKDECLWLGAPHGPEWDELFTGPQFVLLKMDQWYGRRRADLFAAGCCWRIFDRERRVFVRHGKYNDLEVWDWEETAQKFLERTVTATWKLHQVEEKLDRGVA